MATTQQPAASTISQWRVDPSHTRVEFAVKHLMITTVRGHFADVDGTVRENSADFTKSSTPAKRSATSTSARPISSTPSGSRR